MKTNNRKIFAEAAISFIERNSRKEFGCIPGYVQQWIEAIQEYIALDEQSTIIVQTPRASGKEATIALEKLIKEIETQQVIERMAEQTASKLQQNDLHKALENLNISLVDNNGVYRDVADILNEIAVKWRGVFND